MIQQNETSAPETTFEAPVAQIDEMLAVSEIRLPQETERAVRHLASIYH